MTLSSSPLPLPSAVLRHHIDEGSLHTSLKEWHSLKKVPQVLLVTGMVGVGKRSLCHYLAQWILCENTWPTDSEEAGLFGNLMLETEKPTETSQNNLKPCGSCQSCINALKGAWVDFTEIQSEESENDPGNDSGTLKIDQFRKLKSSLGFSGGTGKYRVILIPNADRMTIQAANSVLKLLEEPPAGWIFLLTSSDASLLLPTIVSRCQQLRLKPF